MSLNSTVSVETSLPHRHDLTEVIDGRYERPQLVTHRSTHPADHQRHDDAVLRVIALFQANTSLH